ncbi:hypothetical protein E2C01_062777 [Portunus trituberculatus]|uniref:Uncharacterized protein n=1 Tax=Portunus trituberculatus TaxID=210409 RepID=A0A5B7HG69_PORTR|nr:hypothetical protein [Portunus trituberculatus]
MSSQLRRHLCIVSLFSLTGRTQCAAGARHPLSSLHDNASDPVLHIKATLRLILPSFHKP